MLILLFMLILSIYFNSCLAKNEGIICVSTKCWGGGSYDVTSVWLVLCVLLEGPCVYLGPGV